MENLQTIKEAYFKKGLLCKDEVIAGLNAVTAKRTENIFFGRIEFVTFTTIAESSNKITKDIIEGFSNACLDNACASYDGRGLGNNSGVVSISILLGNEVSQSAKEFCGRASKRHWSARQIHMICDLSNGQFYSYSGWHIFGGLFIPHYRRMTANGIDMVRNAIASA